MLVTRNTVFSSWFVARSTASLRMACRDTLNMYPNAAIRMMAAKKTVTRLMRVANDRLTKDRILNFMAIWRLVVRM